LKIVKIGNKITTLSKTKFGLPLKYIELYHNQIINSIGVYRASVWAHRLNENKKLGEKLNSVQRSVLLRMSGAYKTTPGVALNTVLGIAPIRVAY